MENHERKMNMELHPISHKLSLEIVKKIHQSSDTLPKINKECLGVYINGKLEGTVTLGYGTRPKHTIKKMFPSLDVEDYLEIGRMCINNNFKTNTESQMLSKTVKYVKKNFPNVKLIFTWANGLEGKIGTVYQASNFLYGGYIVTEAYFYKGKKLHPRGIKQFLSPNDERITVRPTPAQKKEYGIEQFRGKQFRYIYFCCGFSEKKRLLKETPLEWSQDYPTKKELSWQKWVDKGKWVESEKPYAKTDSVKGLHPFNENIVVLDRWLN